jgi:hypothetical protein
MAASASRSTIADLVGLTDERLLEENRYLRRREAEMLDVELHLRVRGVDRPRAGGDDDGLSLCEDGHVNLLCVRYY